MSLVKRNSDWFPSLFNDFFVENRLDNPMKNYETFSIPAVNIQENFSNFVVQLAAPGLKKENFSIEVEENVLTVSAKFSEEKDNKEEKENVKFTRREFNYGSFERTFNLPETINVEEINAAYDEGVLNITLPKKEEKKALKKMVEIS